MEKEERVAKANDFSRQLIDWIDEAETDEEIIRICERYEGHVMRLRGVSKMAWHTVVNFVQLRRKEMARSKRGDDQMRMF